VLAIVSLILGFIPPLISGPLAGLTYIYILKHKRGWYQIPFWVLLVVVNLLVMYWVASSSGEWVSISSFSAYVFTPVASFITLLVMRSAWRRLEVPGAVDAARKLWFTFGCVLIPALQVVMFVALFLFGPQLCKVGVLVCQDL
jgi:hypothetical protein